MQWLVCIKGVLLMCGGVLRKKMCRTRYVGANAGLDRHIVRLSGVVLQNVVVPNWCWALVSFTFCTFKPTQDNLTSSSLLLKIIFIRVRLCQLVRHADTCNQNEKICHESTQIKSVCSNRKLF